MSKELVNPKQGTRAITPRWLKVTGIIAVVLIMLIAILHLTGNSLVGPESHSLPIGQSVKEP